MTHVIPLMQNAWFTVLLAAISLLVPLPLLPIAYRRRRAVAVAAFLALSLFIAGTATAKDAEAQSHTLANGIRFVSVYFPGSTNVAIFTFLPMGLAADGLHQAQWAHLVEHLVIRSTVPKDLSVANAETLPDHMRLDFYGNISNWQEGLSHHERWLAGVPFSQAELDAEKPKVKSECDYTAKNFATHKFALAAWAQGYRHAQTNAALLGDIDRAALNDIQTYRDSRLVVVSNVLVCLVGGIEPATALPIISNRLGSIKSGAKPAAPVKLHPGNREMTWDLSARHLLLTWPIADIQSQDFPALQLVAQSLNMRFFSDEQLKKTAGMVIAGADLTTPEGTFFYISASLRPEASAREVQEKLQDYVQQLSSSSDLSLLPMLIQQQTQSLTKLPDIAALKGQMPPGMSVANLEMNIGLQWGMNEFRYGPHKPALVRRFSELKEKNVRSAAKEYLTTSKCSVTKLQLVSR